MSLESGKKLGATASLINILLPVVAIIAVVGFVVSIIASAVSGAASGTVAPTILGISAVFFLLIAAVVLVALAGYIMFMIAMHRLSRYYNELGIFNNVLYAFLLSVISSIVAFSLEFVSLISTISRISQSTTPAFSPVFPGFFIALIVLGVVFGLVNGWLYMRAFNKLKEKSGVDNFGTAGILYLVGTIVPVVGWIAWILAYQGFRKLQPTSNAIPTVSYPAQPPTNFGATQAKRFCPNCGAENRIDALYCTHCGKSLQ